MIDVLLSTYCGERYVAEFIASLELQTYRDFRLLTRDDGSGDATAEVVRDAAAKAGISAVFASSFGKHLGVVGSFGDLLAQSSGNYIMFADQDDVWHRDKIEEMLKRMREAEERYGAGTPILLHSDLRVCDHRGAVMAESFMCYQRISPRNDSFAELLIQNNVTGCAMMINRALRELIRLPFPQEAICHDWYTALIASAFGRIVFADTAYVDYRAHGDNVFGPHRYGIADWFGSFRTGRSDLNRRLVLTQRQAGAFLRQYGDRLDKADRDKAAAWAGIGGRSKIGRVAACLGSGFRKNTALRTLGMWWAI